MTFEQFKYNKQKEQRLKQNQDSEDSLISELDYQEVEFDVLTQRVYCKFSIKAQKTCELLLMEKSNLIKMKCEFPEAFLQLWTSEMLNCKEIIHQKAQHNRYYERQKKIDEFNL